MRKYFELLVMLAVLQSCGDTEPQGETENYSGSFALIQGKIFEPNCVSCHMEGSTFAKQSGLVLSAEEAYGNLIDQIPANAAAREDGLFLLETKGLESLYTSYLWEKINTPDQEHYYSEHAAYGELMPLGLPSLTYGELEYIRQWIVAGAPETGFVADEQLLFDTTRYDLVDDAFRELAKPERGLQMHLGPFDVNPGTERELFQYQIADNESELYVNRIEISMRTGSHHFLLYDFDEGTFLPTVDAIRDLRDENDNINISTLVTMQNQVFVFGTQFRNTDYTFPEGVAMKVPAGKGFDLNSHYVNLSDETIVGELYMNMYEADAADVQHEAEFLFLNDQSFTLPANEETTLLKDYFFNETRQVFMLSSHAHQRMTEYRIYILGGDRDGELVYFTNDWEHPVIMNYDPPLELEAGEGLRAEAIYDNTTDEALRFGFMSTDEMFIIFGSYYTE